MKLKKVRVEKKPKEFDVSKVVLSIDVSVVSDGTLITISDPDGVWRVVQKDFLFAPGKGAALSAAFGQKLQVTPVTKAAMEILGEISLDYTNWYLYNSNDVPNGTPLLIPIGVEGKVEVLLGPSSPSMRKEYGTDLVRVVEALYTAYKSNTGYNFTLLVDEEV